jgi:hypothetical protein
MNAPSSSVQMSNRSAQPYKLTVISTTGFVAIKARHGNIRVYPAAYKIRDEIVLPRSPMITLWPCSEPTTPEYSFPSPSGNLTELVCSGNQISTMSLSGISSLHTLDCSHNCLRRLDIAVATKSGSIEGPANLEYLNCSHNSLTKLDLSNLQSLRLVACSHNRLRSLNLHGLGNLSFLDCSQNRLESLKFNHLLALEYFNAMQNPFPFRRASSNPHLLSL